MNKRLGWNVGRDWHDALASVLVYRALTKTAASSDLVKGANLAAFLKKARILFLLSIDRSLRSVQNSTHYEGETVHLWAALLWLNS